ncbi:MAG: hypothetical protein [Caudoviricetes sp.]|nr:MAG: hypothetical protein [Caudoviricetes sp.]
MLLPSITRTQREQCRSGSQSEILEPRHTWKPRRAAWRHERCLANSQKKSAAWVRLLLLVVATKWSKTEQKKNEVLINYKRN